MTRKVVAALAAALVLQGCSSRPREFTPELSALAASQQEFEAAVATCNQLFVDGKLDSEGRLASAASGAGAAATVGALGGVAASSAGLYTGAAIASATVVAIPFVALAGAWGMARAKRSRKERAIQTAMAGCLKERGYVISGWERAPKAKAAK